MKQYEFIGIIAIFVAMLLVAGCASQTSSGKATTDVVEKETVKIGLVASLTGDNAMLGEGSKSGMVLASEELAKKDTKYNYEFIYEDDRLDNKLSASAAQKLINIDNVDAIISFTSGTGNVINPMAESAKVVHFGIASDANIANGNYNFIHWTQPPEEGRVFVKKLQEEGVKSISVIELNHPGTNAIVDGLEMHISGSGIAITGIHKFNFGDTDFKNMILKIKQENPEMIFIGAIAPEMDLIVKQLNELNVDIPLTSIELFEYTDNPELFNGYWYVQAADPMDSFNQKFAVRFGENAKPGAGNVYDCVNMLVDAYETMGGTEKPTTNIVVAKLRTIKEFAGAMGSLTIDAQGIVNSQAVIKEVRNGEFVTLG